ncbi:MAG: S41 family peptidase [Minisyncoccia bacterium]
MDDLIKNKGSLAVNIVALIVIFFVGYEIGQSNQYQADRVSNTISNATSTIANADLEPFWKAWQILDENYIDTNPTTTEKVVVTGQDRVYGAIEGMVASMRDPYTTFFPPTEAKAFSEEISGQIEGVGMQIDIKDGMLTVISPVKDTPAYRAGIKSGDKILKIDDTITDKLSTEAAVKLIRGKRGTSVKIIVGREGEKEPLTFNIVRDYISLPTVDTEVKKGVYIIHLYTFSAISPNLFRNAIREFWESGNDKLILDLRGNPGGYLEAAQDMASWFLPMNEVVVTESFKRESEGQVYKSRGYDVFDGKKLKMVVMIDGGSASASEILAGALRDHGVATLVGTQSFGKGSVQELFEITDNPKTSLKVTIAKWVTPNGVSISHQGLTPDVEIKLDEEAFKKDRTDNQINKAIEILNSTTTAFSIN